MPHRLRLPAAVVAALVVAEAAVLLLRPKERYPVVASGAASLLQRGRVWSARSDFRSGQLWLFGARTRRRAGDPRGRRRARAARAGGARSRPARRPPWAITLATTPPRCRCAPRRAQRAKDVGLVTQSWGGWAVDVAKGTAIGSVFAAGGGAAARRSACGASGATGGRRARRSSSGFGVVFTYLGPVVLDPVFNKFTPLPAGETRADVLELAERAGVDVGEVYSVDASRRTTAANAYVTGIGRTKRVVLYDTLLKDFTPAETRLVVAHELGHVRHRDVPTGCCGSRWSRRSGRRRRPRRERMTPRRSDAACPRCCSPSRCWRPPHRRSPTSSRARSSAAPTRSRSTLTGEPEAMVGFERRITLKNVGDPDPPRWQSAARHPPADDGADRPGAGSR